MKDCKKILLFSNTAFSMLNFRAAFIGKLIALGHEVHVLVGDSDDERIRSLKQLGCSVHSIPLSRRGMNLFHEFATLLKLCKFIRNLGPEILLSYTIKPVIYASLVCRFISRKPKVNSMITGLGYVFIGAESLKRRLLRGFISFLYRFALRENRVVFFLNEDDLNEFRTRGILSRETESMVIPGEGIDIDAFPLSPLPERRPLRFIFVGRLLKDKGLGLLLSCANRLRDDGAEFELFVYGSTDENPSSFTAEQISSFGQLNSKVRFMGQTKFIAEALRDGHVFVLPSFREGVPVSTLEAMSIGRPIITSDAVGCRDTIEDGFNGFLVRVGDEWSLLRAMRKSLEESYSGLEKMGLRSRQIVESRFQAHTVNKSLIEKLFR